LLPVSKKRRVDDCRKWGWRLSAALALALACAPVSATTFRWANDHDVRSLDPYAGQETFLRSFDANIYEPLVRRGRDMALRPALALAWTQTQPELWRFRLRPGVLFQDGTPFTADDVVFSVARMRSPGSTVASLLAGVREVRAIEDYTVEFTTNGPDPILPEELTALPIMSRVWCEAHEPGYADAHANGTGPFMLAERVPDERTVLVSNPRWWDRRENDFDTAVFTPLHDPEALVAGLESGALDMIYSVPPQDIDRIARTEGLRIVEGPELRTIFLGFDQWRDQLLESNVTGRNPFKDRRVREAFARAIDEQAIVDKVMRGHATPAAILVAPGVAGFDAALDRRAAYDPALARRLLAEAGYAQGFETGMDCPTDRYVNDEAICEEVVAMLARVGITVELHAQPRAAFFAKIMPPGRKTSFYLMGWAPATDDAQDVLVNLAATRASATHDGNFNLGGYSNPALDALIVRIEVESDRGVRLALLSQALALVKDDFAYIPLHRQNVVWATRAGITLVQRADGSFPLRYVRLNE
jgi:peptide/nickel transport system substrate-binding protein